MGRILAVDYGERRLGLALSDESEIVAAQTLPTIDRREIAPPDSAESRIGALAESWSVSEIVVGLPVNMDGSHGEAAQRAAHFAASLAELTGLPVHTWDERLTTVVAKKVQAELNLPRRKRQQKERLDRTAALLLLQNYLDFRRNEAARAARKSSDS